MSNQACIRKFKHDKGLYPRSEIEHETISFQAVTTLKMKCGLLSFFYTWVGGDSIFKES